MLMSNIHVVLKALGTSPSPPQKKKMPRCWFQKSFWFSPLKILEDEPTHFDYCAYFSNGLGSTITQFIMLMSNIHVVLKALGTSPSPPKKTDDWFPFNHRAEPALRVEEKIHLIHFVLLCISQCGASGHYCTIRTADHQGVALCESRG